MATTDYIAPSDMDAALRLLMPENRLIMRIVLHTGRRIGDVLAIRTEQLCSNTIWITEAKTHKRTKIQLPDSLLEPLRENAGSIWAFPGAHDQTRHKTRQAVWADLRRARDALRLRETLGTHSGRKNYAVALMAKYHDIERVQRDLRHSNPAITYVYAFADQMARGKAPRIRDRRK